MENERETTINTSTSTASCTLLKTDEEEVKLIEGKEVARNEENETWIYPANRNRSQQQEATATVGPPPNMTLIRTAGNALQALPSELWSAATNNYKGKGGDNEANRMMAVSVPENVRAGQVMYILTPDGSGRMIEAVVPQGAFPGHTFLVQIPPPLAAQRPPTVTGIPVSMDGESKQNGEDTTEKPENHVVIGKDIERTDLALQQEPAKVQAGSSTMQTSSVVSDSQLMLVHVPKGASPGTKMQVSTQDGRTIEATVPEGNLKEFYIRVPPPKSQHELV